MAVSAADKLLLPSALAASWCGDSLSKKTSMAFVPNKARFLNGCFLKAPPSMFLCGLQGQMVTATRNSIAAESAAGDLLEKPFSPSASLPPQPSLCESGVLRVRGAAMAEVLQRITVLHNEASEASKQASEYLRGADEVQAQAMEEPGGGSAADYNRRAYLYSRSAETVQESKKKGEEVFAELQALQGAVMLDNGTTAADYKRRAEVFTKTAEVFGRRPEDKF